MTASQEKAREIVVKMQFQKYPLMFEQAKICALIAVNEMIVQNGDLYLNSVNADYYKKTNAYLFELKLEIEKL